MSKPSESFYVENSELVQQALKQAGIPPERPRDVQASHLYVGTCGEYWATGTDEGTTPIYKLPQDQEAVYSLLGLPQPVAPLQVGDICKWVGEYPVVRIEGNTGYIAVNREELEYPISILLEKRIKTVETVTETTMKDTYYLSGTPGQLEGFRQDMLALGATAEGELNKPILAVYLDVAGKVTLVYREQLFADGTKLTTSLWEELTARTQHILGNKAPVKLAGYEVELKEDVLHIGCRRVPKKKALTLLKGLKELDEILGSEGQQVDSKDLLAIYDWLLKK